MRMTWRSAAPSTANRILDAVVARDEMNAACLTAQHIQRTTDTLNDAAARLEVPR